MGNKCCSKTGDRPEVPLVNHKKPDGAGPLHLSDRYTPDPHSWPPKNNLGKGGADIIRRGNTPHFPSSGANDRRRIVVGVYSYQAREETDVSFQKGDRMQVLDDTESDWWRVVHLQTRQEGLIPWNFVAEERSVESEDWFFDHISRKEADKLLLSDENPRGTFLVRPSEHNPSGYSLSVKDWEEQRGYHVKHYKIKPLDNGGFYIATNQTFASLPALVLAYTNGQLSGIIGDNLKCVRPARKPRPRMFDLGPELRDNWEIPHSHIRLVKKIAFGHFGEVHHGKWKSIDVAVKTLKKDTMSVEAFLAEAVIMKKFRHQRLLALLAVCTVEEPIYIMTEYLKNGSLLNYLRRVSGKDCTYNDLLTFAEHIADGMRYLEEKKFVHRDLAARNVLVDDNGEAKICDFGLTRAIKDDIYQSTGSQFPVKWTAPEAIAYREFTTKSDVWSYGILLMELFTYGERPYPKIDGKDLLDLLRSGYRMPKPQHIHLNDAIYDWMMKCWEWKPLNRPSFAQILAFFQSLNSYDDSS